MNFSAVIRCNHRYFKKYIKIYIVVLSFIDQITFSQNIENNLNKNFNFRKIFKITLINENSCLQMYPNEISFLAYWLLRIKWLFAKSGKTTKNRVMYKNRLFSSFYCLVIAELKRKVNFAMICWEQYLIDMFDKLKWYCNKHLRYF